MADVRQVTDRFAVAPQIEVEDFAALKAMGFRHVINNRPDGEAMGQPSSAEAEQAARAAGLTYTQAPFVGQPTPEAVKAAEEAISGSNGPTIAYCRSGTRSIHAWAMATARAGALTPEQIVEKGAAAGYNLAPMKDLLRKLASG